jgi:putative MFS transporter
MAVHAGESTASRDRVAEQAPAVRGRRFLEYLGAPPSVTAYQHGVLWVVGAVTLFGRYGLGLMGLALPQVQAGLRIAEADIGAVTALVQLGVIPAIALSVLADYVGRRRLLLVTLVGFTVCTGLTAFVGSAPEFIALQVLARVFITAETMLAVVVVAEELDAEARGWGIGVIGALGALGHGLAAVLFTRVNVLPYGWRALFGFGVLPLLLLPWFRRTLVETRRFTLHRDGRGRSSGVWAALRPLRNVLHMYPGRMLALCAALFPAAFVFETAMMFQAKFLQEAHHYSPTRVGLLYLTVGALAPIGNVMGGRLGDGFGRKRVIVVGLFLNATAIALFYNASGVWIPLAWGLMVLSLTVVIVLFAALGSELFPTSYRSTASGVRGVITTLGGAAGLGLEGSLYLHAGSHAAAITWMLAAAPIAPLVIALFLPETASQELEEISPEREA